MEDFSYVDLFATKGIEYILVIGFFLIFIIYWQFLDKREKATVAVGTKAAGTPDEWFHLAKNAFYHPGHSWVIPESKNIVKIGIDDFAHKLLGKPDSINLPGIGTRIEQGENGWQMLFGSKSINLLSPVSGEIVGVNKDGINSPESIMQDPYDKGWLLKVRVPKLKSNLKNLLTGRMAIAWMENTVFTLRGKMTRDLGLVMQDGGLPVSGFARQLAPDNWEQLAEEFFLSN